MDQRIDRAAYYSFLLEMLNETGLQLEADSDSPHPVRYGEHLAEMRHALQTAAVAVRFILADLVSEAGNAQPTSARDGQVSLH